MLSRVTSVLVVPATLIAWLAPPLVEARSLTQPEGEGAVEATAEPPSGEDDPVQQAQRLFDQGATKYETADYIGAIELWTEAFGLVPSVPENASVKARLIANIAAAQERAYSVDKEVSHLNQAKILIERYRDALDEIYPDEIEREKERVWVNDRLTKIDAELQVVAEREAAEKAAAEKAAAEQAAAEQAEQPPPPPPGRGLVIGGSVLAGVGAAGLGVMVGGMVLGSSNDDISDLPTNDLDTRADRFRMGRLGNALAIAGGVGGGVLLGVGVALLVVGLKKNRAAEQNTAKLVVVPVFDGTQTGVGLVGRF
jgi:hypothetical protein